MKGRRKRSRTCGITASSFASLSYYNIFNQTITSSRIRRITQSIGIELYQNTEDTDHPASTNSNYVINNITTNITCMQVLTTVLLMICNGQNPGSSTSGTSHNKFSKMPPPTSMHLRTRCRVLRVVRRSS